MQKFYENFTDTPTLSRAPLENILRMDHIFSRSKTR